MSGTTKSPGQDNTNGTLTGRPRTRNRRVNRYLSQAAGGGNRTDNRHKERRSTTIGFSNPDQITDSGNALGQFEVGEFVEVERTSTNDGVYECDTVVVGQIDTIEQTISLQAAGSDYRVKSRNNRIESRFS